ncbi:hypothetical protein HW555_000913 [Spodoptera exigua]|uniref:Uncharacterized protein n=1 Tax=Spodoptera exigua TaxID=7107 RepID=A0A835GT18_SPOEX|nr:hypothetical protein HW555_000913 [Spodoptera exigua]
MDYNSHKNTNDRILDLVLSNNYLDVAKCSEPLVSEDPHHTWFSPSVAIKVFYSVNSLLTFSANIESFRGLSIDLKHDPGPKYEEVFLAALEVVEIILESRLKAASKN